MSDRFERKDSSGFSVLDHGHVVLEAVGGTELTIVNAARVSFGKRSEILNDADKGLVGYLLRNRHGSPFELADMTFNIKLPIFVMREHVRHRIASLNEMSGRYVELPEEWYVPRPEDVRVRVGRPGHYTYEQASDDVGFVTARLVDSTSREAFARYSFLLAKGVAPEVARLVLPVNTYTEIWWKINVRSLLNYLSLRNAPTAQWEIQQYAKCIEILFSEHFPTVHTAFIEAGRVAP